MKTTNIKGFIVKLQLNNKDKQYFLKLLGCKRFIWNEALSYKTELYNTFKRKNPCLDNNHEKILVNELNSNNNIQKAFAKKELRKIPEYSFLLEVPAEIVQQSLNDLNKSFQNFYKYNKKYPKYKKKYDSKQSIRFSYGLKIIRLNNKNVKIKIGKRSFNGINPFSKGDIFKVEINNITISKDSLNNFYASVSYSQTNNVEKNNSVLNKAIGVDVGIEKSVTTSNEEVYNLPKSLKNIQSKRKILQKRYKNKTKGSISWKKLKLQIAKNYRKETNIRKDFQHKLSDQLTKNHGLIIHEDLKIKNMSKSAKGTIEKPGKNVTQKSGLNREILNQGWGQLFEFLEYKSKERGVELIKVAPQGTSQICSKCEYKDPESRKGKFFKCTSCGFELDADINGAKNILTRGQRGIAERGSLTKLSPMTSELETSPLE